MIKAIIKAPKEHMREISDNSGNVYQTSGTDANPEGRSEIMKGLGGEARDLDLIWTYSSYQKETTEEFLNMEK